MHVSVYNMHYAGQDNYITFTAEMSL